MDFRLAAWTPAHIAGVAKHANNQNIADYLRDVFPHPYTYTDAQWYVNDCIQKADNGQLCRAIEINGEAVGSVGVFVQQDVYRKSAELGYWLAEAYWGQGIMTAAVEQICREAFAQFDIVRIFAEPFAHNTGSRRVLEKNGFVREGILKNSVCKHGQLYDSCIYALLKK